MAPSYALGSLAAQQFSLYFNILKKMQITSVWPLKKVKLATALSDSISMENIHMFNVGIASFQLDSSYSVKFSRPSEMIKNLSRDRTCVTTDIQRAGARPDPRLAFLEEQYCCCQLPAVQPLSLSEAP